MTVSKPSPIMERLGRPDPAGAHLEERRRGQRSQVAQRPERRGWRRRLRTVRAHRAQEEPIPPVRGQPELLGRSAEGRRRRLPHLLEPGLTRPGAEEGRDRHGDRPRSWGVQVPAGCRGGHRRERRLHRVELPRLQRRRGPGGRHTHRRRQPGARGQGLPGRALPRRGHRDAREAGPQRLRQPRHHGDPAHLPDVPPGATPGPDVRPGPRRAAARRGRLPARSGRASGSTRRASRSS